jgi:hypothetical protein
MHAPSFQLLAFPFTLPLPWSSDPTGNSSASSSAWATVQAAFGVAVLNVPVVPYWIELMLALLAGGVLVALCLPAGGGRHVMLYLQSAESVVVKYTAVVLWFVCSFLSTALLLPVTNTLLRVFACTAGPASSPAVLLYDRSTVCWTPWHISMVAAVALLLPLYLFFSLRAFRVHGDINRFCAPVVPPHDTASTGDAISPAVPSASKAATSHEPAPGPSATLYSFWDFRGDKPKSAANARHFFART